MIKDLTLQRDLKEENTAVGEEMKPEDLSTASDTGADTADDDIVEGGCSSPFVCDEMSADESVVREEKVAEDDDEKMTSVVKEELRYHFFRSYQYFTLDDRVDFLSLADLDLVIIV